MKNKKEFLTKINIKNRNDINNLNQLLNKKQNFVISMTETPLKDKKEIIYKIVSEIEKYNGNLRKIASSIYVSTFNTK